MQYTFALAAALASLAYAAPQAVTSAISPEASAPAGCAASYSGKFEITAYNESAAVAKRDLEKRTCGAEGSLTIELVDGILTDAAGRLGYIASNYQFQFDGPPQAGAIYTAGWSVCNNGSLALGGSNIFYQCKSGNPDGGESGAFYNLYDRKAFGICTPAVINILPCAGSSSGGAAGQQPDGQPTGASATAPPVSQISDGQPQAASGGPPPISQITDGQIQVPTDMPAPPISQIGDGQIQAPTGNPISQIGDGQIQAPTATAGPAISQIGDGQIQAPTGNPISQIGDGQIQAPTGNPISQISDGQIQAPTATTAAGPAISQIPDGQIQAPTGTGNASNVTATATPTPFLGSASSISASLVTVFGAVMAIALL